MSIASSNNGPLIELAALKEYGEPLKPKIVLWLYYVGDFGNLIDEMKSSILKKYLNENDYSQNLISRQEEIDGVLINYVQTMWEKEREKERAYETKLNIPIRERETKLDNSMTMIISLLKLSKLRKMINLIPIPTGTVTSTSTSVRTSEHTRSVFRDILSKSKQMVSAWNGKMYLVYLPDFERYSTGNAHPNHDFVMQTAIKLDIPIIDIHREVFDPHPDPLSLFPFRMSGHYNAEGYRLVAEAIGKRLEVDGYVPIESKK